MYLLFQEVFYNLKNYLSNEMQHAIQALLIYNHHYDLLYWMNHLHVVNPPKLLSSDAVHLREWAIAT